VIKKRYILGSLALLLLIPLIVCYLYLFGHIRNFSLCQKRFDGVLLEEFTELNKAKVAKVVVEFYDAETPIEITEPEKIDLAFHFMKGRHDDWQEPCLVPVSDLVRVNFFDETGAEIAHYGFWSRYIVYYGYLNQKNLPPIVLLPVDDDERTTLFEALGVSVERVNQRLGFESK
jgi:hypothetical protein